MGKIEAQMEDIHGVASRFAVLQDDDSMDWTEPKAKSSKGEAKADKGKTPKKTGNKQKGISVDLQEAAFRTTSSKTKKNKAEKKKSDNQNDKELEKLKTLFANSSLSSSSEDEPHKDQNNNTFNTFNSKSNCSTEPELNKNKVKKVSFLDSREEKEEKITVQEPPLNAKEAKLKKKKSSEEKQTVDDPKNKKQSIIEVEHSNVLLNQLNIDLEKKDLQISKLKASKDKLKTDLENVNERYTLTRAILERAEMKSRAELAKEVNEIREVREEMSQNIIALTKELEQYKTKTQTLNKELRNIQGKQKHSTPG